MVGVDLLVQLFEHKVVLGVFVVDKLLQAFWHFIDFTIADILIPFLPVSASQILSGCFLLPRLLYLFMGIILA